MLIILLSKIGMLYLVFTVSTPMLGTQLSPDIFLISFVFNNLDFPLAEYSNILCFGFLLYGFL